MRIFVLLGLILAGIFIIPQIQTSESTLWDLIILSNLEKNQISVDENPVIQGKVVNHAEKSVAHVQITIRVGSQTVFTESDDVGEFKYEFTDFHPSPGHYVVFISANAPDGRVGYSSLNLDISGDVIISQTANIINSAEAQYYLNSDPAKFENDPIAIKLYQYYQSQYQKYQKEAETLKKINEYQTFLNAQKSLAEIDKQKTIDEKNPGPGIFSGRNYDVYVDNLDPSIKDIVVNQLNHTKNMFQQARDAMNEVLNNGGTMDEARKAYFERVSISREQMESLTKIPDPIAPIVENVTSSDFPEITLPETQTIQDFSINGTGTNLSNGNTIVSLYVNGTLIQFIVNGTQIIPLNNATIN